MKKSYLDILVSILNILLLVILIIVVIYGVWLFFSGGFAGFFGDIYGKFKQPTYIPPIEETCSDYNIPTEFRSAFGDRNINALRTMCYNNGGVWTEQKNQLSCYQPPIAEGNCDATGIRILERFCEDNLKANWVCDESLAFAGCLCNTNPPSKWVVPEPEKECGEDYYTNQGQCGGKCPTGETCIKYQGLVTEVCECKPDSWVEEHKDKTYCNYVDLPSFGDLGGICAENGWCNDSTQSCSHYYDYNSGKHECECSDTFYCGQYCFGYSMLVENGCECPPNSYKNIIDRSTFQCIPDGHSCNNGQVI